MGSTSSKRRTGLDRPGDDPNTNTALEQASAALGPDHADLASLYHNLGGLEHARSRHAKGEPYARRSVEIREAALGADHPVVAEDVAALAALIEGQGRLDEAEPLYRPQKMNNGYSDPTKIRIAH